MAKRAIDQFITGRRVRLSPRLRERIERNLEKALDAVEVLVRALDEEDGDCEDEGADHDGREPDTDMESSLGWVRDPIADEAIGTIEALHNPMAREVTGCWAGLFADRELDESDSEPSLGWTIGHNGVGSVRGGSSDRECDAGDEPEEVSEDEGAACEDEGAQVD